MKITEYLKDKIFTITVLVIFNLLLMILLWSIRINPEIKTAVFISEFLAISLIFGYDYNRKKKFYNEFLETLESLDKKYIITSLIKKPEFLEGKIFYNSLYEINKKMNDEIISYRNELTEFKEYLEMLVHDIKLPISSLYLMEYAKDDISRIKIPLKKIEDLTEQILFYSRSENMEQDYLIKKINLRNSVNKVIKKNKEIFLLKKVKIKIEIDPQLQVLSDSKWLKFIINQIISNSLKYMNKDIPELNIKGYEKENNKYLEIMDNGIGIPAKDIKRIFNKGFTGENGRNYEKSTGMGLYICKKLCSRLNHEIYAQSEKGRFTKIIIKF